MLFGAIRSSRFRLTFLVVLLTALNQAATEINGFFSNLSYGKINLVIKPARVTMPNTAAHYYGHCEVDTNPVAQDRCTQFTQDAVTAEKAVNGHFFDGVSGVSTLIAQQGNGQFTWTPIDVGLGTPTPRMRRNSP
jgi:hypothetical protein